MNRPTDRLAMCVRATLVLSRTSADDGVAFFESRIRPVFVEHCYKSHCAEGKKVKGALKLDTKEDLQKDGAAVGAGSGEESRAAFGERCGVVGD